MSFAGRSRWRRETLLRHADSCRRLKYDQRWGKLDRRKHSTRSIHIYEIRPRADKHGFDLSSDALRYSPLWYRGSNAMVDAVAYARSYSRRHPVVIRVYDGTGNVIETHEHAGGRFHVSWAPLATPFVP